MTEARTPEAQAPEAETGAGERAGEGSGRDTRAPGLQSPPPRADPRSQREPSLTDLLDPAWLERLPDAQRGEAERHIAALRAQVDANPLFAWRPLRSPRRRVGSPQADFLALDRDCKRQLLAGGNRGGKTEVGVVKGLLQVCPEEFVPRELAPFKHWERSRGRIVSPDFKQQAMVVHEKIRRLVPRGALEGGEWAKAYDKRLGVLRFVGGSYIEFKTAEQDVDAHAGADLDWVHFDEEPPGEKGRLVYQENVVRLLDRGGALWLTMTPLLGLSWAYEELYERRAEKGYALVSLSMDDNPTIDPEQKAALLAGFTEDELKARRDGHFVHFKGRVFAAFDDRAHVVRAPSREHVSECEVVVGIDPGLTQTGVVWVAYDSAERATVFAELALTSPPVDVVCEEIRRINREWGIGEPLFYVIDPSARNRTLTTAESVEGEYIRCGVCPIHGQNAVEAGVMLLRRKLESDPPSMVVSEDCGQLRWQIGRYRRDDRTDGSFAVVKAHDHLVDAWRYAAMSRPYDIGVPPVERRRRGWVPGTFDLEWEQAGLRAGAADGPPMGPMS